MGALPTSSIFVSMMLRVRVCREGAVMGEVVKDGRNDVGVTTGSRSVGQRGRESDGPASGRQNTTHEASEGRARSCRVVQMRQLRLSWRVVVNG